MATAKLLIVEDDVALQELLALALRRHRIRCDLVTSAEDALMMLETTGYTGLIVDLALPGMDGWTLLETVQRCLCPTELWCVAVTAHHDAAVEAAALEAGFNAYFCKPLDITRFVSQLQEMLNWAVM